MFHNESSSNYITIQEKMLAHYIIFLNNFINHYKEILKNVEYVFT